MDIAVSFKSIDQALSSLKTQLVGKTFAHVQNEALNAWQAELNRLTIEGGTPASRRMFYSSLYRCFLMAADRTNGFNEFTPNYPPYDDNYATWDGWRTLFHFMASSTKIT
ncbi:MAG: glycoside hydrolase family 92 protein [Chthoniobacterales bacterium]|nr:glycoside hydrolase family 92 protein [Chthoniobacterales bacterium]